MNGVASVLDKILKKLTPGRARAAVLLYGAVLKVTPVPYKHMRITNAINYSAFYDAFMRREKSVWTTLLTPSELLHALGFSPIVMESVGGVLGTLGLVRSFLKNTIETGVPSSLCTFHRAHLSIVLKNGFYPPAFVMAVSALCDGNLRGLQEISGLFDRPFHFIDVSEPGAPGAEDFLTEQLEDIFLQLAGTYDVKNPVERLKRTIETAERTRQVILEVNALRKELYFPGMKTGSLAWSLLNHTSRLGTEGALAYFTALREDLGKKGRPIPVTALRLLMMHLPPTYPHPVLELLRRKNALFVIEEFNAVQWPAMDPEDPFGSIARKMLSHPQHGPSERRIDLVNTLGSRYSLDGIIHFSHWGCRQSNGSLGAMKKHIRFPFLSVETDLVDPESSSAGQIQTRVESFLEMLRAGKTQESTSISPK